MQFTERVKRLTQKYFVGEVKVQKTTFWLIGVVCLLAGVVYGVCIAPMTHGIAIGCNCGNHYIQPEEKQEKEEEEE